MSKIIFRPVTCQKGNQSKGSERITIQLRKYNQNGKYSREGERSNETIHFKDCTLSEAFEIIKSALMNSRHVNTWFEVEE